jgi:2-keto-4-pentenoate hydratase
MSALDDPRLIAGMRSQLAARSRLLGEGADHVGWKVGFGSQSSLEAMQIDRPLVGYLTDATIVADGDAVEVIGWARGVVEFEIAVLLGSDLPGGSSVQEARAAVSAVGPAIELADIDLPLEPSLVERILAGDIFHKGVSFGALDHGRAGLETGDLVGRILIDGTERFVAEDFETTTGDYGTVVRTVADTLAASGELLRKGDLIITGSVVAPVPVGEGEMFTFALDPFEPISIRIR